MSESGSTDPIMTLTPSVGERICWALLGAGIMGLFGLFVTEPTRTAHATECALRFEMTRGIADQLEVVKAHPYCLGHIE